MQTVKHFISRILKFECYFFKFIFFFFLSLNCHGLILILYIFGSNKTNIYDDVLYILFWPCIIQCEMRLESSTNQLVELKQIFFFIYLYNNCSLVEYTVFFFSFFFVLTFVLQRFVEITASASHLCIFVFLFIFIFFYLSSNRIELNDDWIRND